MEGRGDVLRDVMLETGTTQSELARLSGVRQPSISQTLSGRIEVSDEQLDRLLSCMGYRLEVVRQPVTPSLNRSEKRSWRLHRELSRQLNGPATLDQWTPTIQENLGRLRRSSQGQPHERNLSRWSDLVSAGDIGGLHRVLTGLDRESVEMREVSPMGGVLTEQQRSEALVRTR